MSLIKKICKPFNASAKVVAFIIATSVPIVGISSTVAPSAAYAQGVPTFDAQALLQQLQNFDQMLTDMGIQQEQLSQLIEQIRLAEEQLARLGEIEDLLSDPTEILSMALGGDLDGILEGEFDVDMIGTLVNGAQGNWDGLQGAGASEFINKIETAFEAGGTTSAEIEALATSGVPEAERNAQATTTGAATSAAAEVAYEEAAQSVDRIGVLMDEMPGLDSLKESVDHNTRVTAELAIAMAAMWQLESVQTMNVGMAGVLDAATLADIEKFSDFTLPDLE